MIGAEASGVRFALGGGQDDNERRGLRQAAGQADCVASGCATRAGLRNDGVCHTPFAAQRLRLAENRIRLPVA